MKKSAILLLIMGLTITRPRAAAQAPQPEIIDPSVKTARILPQGADFGYPIARLGDPLTLSFDIIDDQHTSLCYTIRHCDSDLNPDDLDFSEYADAEAVRDAQPTVRARVRRARFVHDPGLVLFLR